MQKQAGTLQGFGYVEQNPGEVIWRTAVQAHSLNFGIVGTLLLAEWVSLQSHTLVHGWSFHAWVRF